jgi:hypothetical protein
MPFRVVIFILAEGLVSTVYFPAVIDGVKPI